MQLLSSLPTNVVAFSANATDRRRSTTVKAIGNQLWKNYVPIPIYGEYIHIPAPQPDITIGFYPHTFGVWHRTHRLKASYSLRNGKKAVGCYDAVHDQTKWPMITIELKGEQEPVGKATTQNAHNGAVMTANLMRLKERAGLEVPYGKAYILTISMDVYSIVISAHWAIWDAEIKAERYLHRTIKSWLIKEGSLEDLIDSRRAISNCIERHMEAMLTMIRSDLELVKARSMTADTTPPEHVCQDVTRSNIG